MFIGLAKPEHPQFRFGLIRLGDRNIGLYRTAEGGGGRIKDPTNPMGDTTDWIVINGVDIGWGVVETITPLKVQTHAHKATITEET